ncbi:putative 3-phosphoshikimate 1-carboxyvinyltransferase [Bacteriovorax sp. BSW11_IV]|uniref:3-phosphoshikimate 1-carboxyvinyltransferase n=1 Tax=Bacteriovorax sp. BSW11_IV TaxID=1353529 RepID=UPI000389FD13|nr:3-phosphoshikimate 1-carboxyvinyltransferase [Bacteriovorax sp. BSW11_IV]EQC48252.1 putative 3-phosphoshikimate 1-carboxyvinyltransferase [Bacteriovorax sp. BSW11_IV]
MHSKTYRVENNPFNKKVEIPTSKSYANRALILAAIDKRDIIIHNMPESSDVENMIECLRKIGLKILRDNETVTIKGSFPECEVKSQSIVTLKTGDGGTTNRFLIPLLALGKNKYQIEPKGHMKERPMDELYKVLGSLGVNFEKNQGGWPIIQGPISSDIKSVEVDCKKTTQFATGMQLALSHLGIAVVAKNLSTSKSYFDLTLNLIEDFKKTSEFEVPVDFSSLSYPIALALVCGKVNVTNCHHIDSLQADSKFLSIISKMGGVFELNSKGLAIEKQELRPGFFDCTDCPDLIPTLAFLCAHTKGTSSITGVNVLRFKESDRLMEIIRLLKAYSIDFTLNEEGLGELLIQGTGIIKDKVMSLTPPDDHRMVMVSYLFLRANGGGELTHSNSVTKSFPDFFDVMEP